MEPRVVSMIDDRFDPFVQIQLSASLTEQHVVPIFAPFWVALDEVPLEESPSSVIVYGFTEVNAPPRAGQYRVDYRYKTGYIQFHASDAGKIVSVSYKGLGSPIRAGWLNAMAHHDPDRSWATGIWHLCGRGDHFPSAGDLRTWSTWNGPTIISKHTAAFDSGGFIAGRDEFDLTQIAHRWALRFKADVPQSNTLAWYAGWRTSAGSYALGLFPAANTIAVELKNFYRGSSLVLDYDGGWRDFCFVCSVAMTGAFVRYNNPTAIGSYAGAALYQPGATVTESPPIHPAHFYATGLNTFYLDFVLWTMHDLERAR